MLQDFSVDKIGKKNKTYFLGDTKEPTKEVSSPKPDENDKKYRFDTPTPEKVINIYNDLKQSKKRVSLNDIGRVILQFGTVPKMMIIMRVELNYVLVV